jgi:nitrogen fixation protein NifB
MKPERWEDIGSKYAHLTSLHPCYSHKAHFSIARLHLPVAPRCNIQCNYCIRKIDKCEHRPGIASCILKPREALERVEKAVAEIPNLKVVGVAGPGEALANPETFETFALVNEEYPELTKCIATNGLLLSEKVGELVEVGVGSVTVTINTLNPATGSKIYSWVRFNGKNYRGKKGAEILIGKQLEGIERASQRGLVVKVNTVLIPGINFEEIRELAIKVREQGAILMNIIPLIPLHKFEKMAPPSCDDLNIARSLAEEYIPQFRLCKQCRADAVGIPGLEPCGSPVQRLLSSEYYHG